MSGKCFIFHAKRLKIVRNSENYNWNFCLKQHKVHACWVPLESIECRVSKNSYHLRGRLLLFMVHYDLYMANFDLAEKKASFCKQYMLMNIQHNSVVRLSCGQRQLQGTKQDVWFGQNHKGIQREVKPRGERDKRITFRCDSILVEPPWRNQVWIWMY